MHIGGGRCPRGRAAASRRGARSAAFGVALIAPLVLAGGRRRVRTVRHQRRFATTASRPWPPSAAARQPVGRDGRRGHQAADPVPHRRRQRLRSPAGGRGEFTWQPSHSGDGADRVPQCRADDGSGLPGLRRELEPVGRHRAHRVAARQRRRHRRARHPGAARSTGRRWTARCPATRSSSRACSRRPRHLRPRDGTDAVPARHVVALRLRRRR